MVSRSSPRRGNSRWHLWPAKTDRAQAFTLEAFVASLLLVTALVVALGSTAVTPLSASGSSAQVEPQQAAIAEGVLDAATSSGSLRVAVLFWNNSNSAFHGVPFDPNYENEGDYTAGGPPNEFGRLLNRTFDGRDIAYNVNVWYINETTDANVTSPPLSESLVNRPMVTMGQPSDTGVRAIRLVTLYDDSVLYDADETRTSMPLSDPNSTFYAPDAHPGPIYNVVQVEVVVWRV